LYFVCKIKELGITIEELKTATLTISLGGKTHSQQGTDSTPNGIAQSSTQPAATSHMRTEDADSHSHCPMRVAYRNIVRKKRSNALSLSSSREIDPPDETSSRIAQEVCLVSSILFTYLCS
jgi:hypothetical protein